MRYYLASKALRSFSATPLTKYVYRKSGNFKRNYISFNVDIPYKYFLRSSGFLDLIESYEITKIQNPDILEIGTGWVHWESLILRNKAPCRVLLYDIWDNRSFRKFRAYARHLTDPGVRKRLGLDDDPSAITLMKQVAECGTFADAYRLLGFRYLVDSSGMLNGVPEESFDLAVSSDVGEHIPRETLPAVLTRSFQALRPGGWAYHQIVLADHLTIYDRKIHPKEYLRFSREHYESKLLSEVQYINMVQVPEWLELFRGAGFETVEVNRIGTSDLSLIEVHPSWKEIEPADLACTVIQVLLRRPVT